MARTGFQVARTAFQTARTAFQTPRTAFQLARTALGPALAAMVAGCCPLVSSWPDAKIHLICEKPAEQCESLVETELLAKGKKKNQKQGNNTELKNV